MKRGALAAWLSMLVFGATARAQTLSVNDQVSAGAGMTDNPGFRSDQVRAAQGTPGLDAFGNVGNVLTLGVAGAESSHHLSYTFGATRYLRQGGQSFMNHALQWTSMFQLSERLVLTLGAGVRYLATNAAQLQAEAMAGVFEARPSGNYRLFSLSAGQGLVWNISNQWGVKQGVSVTVPIPVGSSTLLERGVSGAVDLAVSRTWTVAAVRGTLRAGGARPFAHTDTMLPPEMATRRLPHFVEPLVGLNYLFTPTLSADAAGGVVFSRRDVGAPWHYGPAGSVGLTWNRLPGSAMVGAYRSATTSLWLPTILVTSGVRGSVGYQIGERQPLMLSAFGSYSVGRTVSSGDAVQRKAVHYVTGLGAAFSPTMRYDLRIVGGYFFALQKGSGQGELAAFNDVRQNVFSLGVSAGFPSDAPPF